MATTDTDVSKKRLQKEKPNLYKRMHSDQPGEERQGFVDVVEKFRYMKITADERQPWTNYENISLLELLFVLNNQIIDINI